VGLTVVVIGAGLAGLSAAWELRQAGADVIVLEGQRRPGGVVVTERPDGFVVEGGPDGFLAAEPAIEELARELGLGPRLVDQRAKGSMLWTGTRLEPLPEGRAAELLGIQDQPDIGAGHESDAGAGDAPDVGARHALPLLNAGFRTFAGGMAEIIEALTARLGPVVRTAQGVSGITPTVRGWRLALTGGSTRDADGVILALPAWSAVRLLAAAGVPGARELESVVYYPSTTVSLAYRAAGAEHALPVRAGHGPPLQGAGFIAARESGSGVRACTYAWLKYPGRAPPGHALLRAFVEQVEGDPAAVAHAALAAILGVTGSPLWSRTFHWVRGLPRYKPGHARRVAAVRQQLAHLAPLDIAGAGFDGAGVSACVKSGREAARRLMERV
jgi:protoporphyrinogen/coproporphyrinogen III oxidase